VRAVADTSPLCYLLLIDQIEILPALFEKVLIPRAVAAELNHPAADRKLRSWIASPPPWIEILEAPPAGTGMDRLDAGEREAISLAEAIGADLLILDERKARQVALERGLSITGLLGILADAADRELIDLAQVFGRLQRTSFRADPKLFKRLLDE
jgi:predicted nucleic acid-binding protein